MKKHKKYILIIGIIIILIGGTGGYYVWCAYHPEIDIQVTDFGKGDEYKIQMPSIVIAPRGTPKIASAVDVKLLQFKSQYEKIYHDIIENYKGSDVKLAIEVTDKQTILKYTGTVTTFEGETLAFDGDIACDFVLDANIIN